MPATVTRDLREARRIVCSGYRTARYFKHEAHRRQRARARRLLRQDDYDADFRVEPATGWDVA